MKVQTFLNHTTIFSNIKLQKIFVWKNNSFYTSHKSKHVLIQIWGWLYRTSYHFNISNQTQIHTQIPIIHNLLYIHSHRMQDCHLILNTKYTQYKTYADTFVFILHLYTCSLRYLSSIFHSCHCTKCWCIKNCHWSYQINNKIHSHLNNRCTFRQGCTHSPSQHYNNLFCPKL